MTHDSLTHVSEIVLKHFAHVFYFDLGRYLIAAGVAAAVLLVFRGYAKARRIQDRRATSQDYRREILSSLRTVFFFGVTTLATVVGVETGGITFDDGEASGWIIALHFAIGVLAHEAYF